MFGKLFIAGTRIPVEIILNKLETGQTIKKVSSQEHAQAILHKVSH